MRQESYKNAVIYGEITAFGTPGETRTHYLALRRRTLYPGELRGRMHKHCTEKKWWCQQNYSTFFVAASYTDEKIVGGGERYVCRAERPCRFGGFVV